MAILAECPSCRKKQTAKTAVCKCGEDLEKARKSKRVGFWIAYRIRTGQDDNGKPKYKQLREYVGTSIKEARDAEGKRRGQKRENKIFDMLPDSITTFKELADWYLELETVKALKSHSRLCGLVANFNKDFGGWTISDLTNVDLESYQIKRKNQGCGPRTIDYETSTIKTMINKAVDNRKISADALFPFRSVKRKLKKGANARQRTIDNTEYKALLDKAADHLKAALTIAINTGMRQGEIRKLKWGYVDWQSMFIRLPAEAVKEGKDKSVPINRNVAKVLRDLKPPLQPVGDDHHDFVITYRGRPLAAKEGFKSSFKYACKEAKVPYGMKNPDGVIFHDLRATVKTNMEDAGVRKARRDKILGHIPQDMDAHYLRLKDSHLTQAMDQYTDWLDDWLKDSDEKINTFGLANYIYHQ